MSKNPFDRDGNQPLYRQLAEWLGNLISEGTYETDSRLPSIRQLSEQLSVSRTTVVYAYRLLEDWGFVEARSRSGYFVQSVQDRQPRVGAAAPPSWDTTPKLFDVASASDDPTVRMIVAGANLDVLQLGVALPNPEFYPTDRLSRLLSRVMRHQPAVAARYCPSPGFEPLRVQIARRAVAAGVSISPEDVVITNGACEALFLSVRAVLGPGMRVAVASPTYYVFLEQLNQCSVIPVEIAADPQEGVNLDALREAHRSKSLDAIFLMPNIANPTGALMPDATKEQVLAFAGEHGLPIIEDHVHAELAYSDARPRSLRAFDNEADVLWCGSFSKTLAPGFRIGWMVPGVHREKVAKLKATSSVASPTPQQIAIAEFLEEGGYDHHLTQLREAFRGAVETMLHLVDAYFPDQTIVHQPRGGYLLWLELPEGVDSIRLAQQALEHKIGVGPGPMFSPGGKFQNFIRLNCAVSWTARTRQSVRRLGELVEEQVRG
jgi:DNA-binding transcriptional MocR family regulator